MPMSRNTAKTVEAICGRSANKRHVTPTIAFDWIVKYQNTLNTRAPAEWKCPPVLSAAFTHVMTSSATTSTNVTANHGRAHCCDICRRYVRTARRAVSSGGEDQTAATGGHQHVLGAVDLVRCSAAHLAHALEDVVHPVDVRLAEEPTVGIHRELAADLDVAAGDEIGGLARAAEPERLELDEHDRREVLVDH